MVAVDVGRKQSNVLQSAKHVLFVEGDEQSLDTNVLEELLGPRFAVKSLGGSQATRLVAKCLFKHHSDYWFVIDRDHWADKDVEQSWQDFPNPEKHNLLIWRRKELENYFLEPAWLAQSEYLKSKPKPTEDSITKSLEKTATKLVYQEAANRTLIAVRHGIKSYECDLLSFSSHPSQSEAEAALLAHPALQNWSSQVQGQTNANALKERFQAECKALTGGSSSLKMGIGQWRERLSGKELFHGLVNKFFVVPKFKNGPELLLGRQAALVVAKNLVKNHPAQIPADLIELKRMLETALAK